MAQKYDNIEVIKFNTGNNIIFFYIKNRIPIKAKVYNTKLMGQYGMFEDTPITPKLTDIIIDTKKLNMLYGLKGFNKLKFNIP